MCNTNEEDPLVTAKKAELDTITIDGETFYIAERDLLLTERELHEYATKPPAPDIRSSPPEELIAILQGQNIVRWKHGLALSYCIVRHTLSAAEYATLRDAMWQATSDWENTCGVRFEHRRELDQGPGTGALFSVRGIDHGGKLLAAAFFPHDPPARRLVQIDPSFFIGHGFDPAGILRHELGHVLGFRHEHIRGIAASLFPEESRDGTLDLTEYDRDSVMHYVRGEFGNPGLTITARDTIGAQRVYGPPLHKVQFFE
jgi:Matrixin